MDRITVSHARFVDIRTDGGLPLRLLIWRGDLGDEYWDSAVGDANMPVAVTLRSDIEHVEVPDRQSDSPRSAFVGSSRKFSGDQVFERGSWA